MYNVVSRLKYLDPVYTTTAGEIADIPDPEWLAKLEEAVRKYFDARLFLPIPECCF